MPEATPGGITKIVLTDASGTPYDLTGGGGNASPGVVSPSDFGLLAWSHHAAVQATGTIIPTAGLLHLVRLKPRAAGTLTSLALICSAAGIGLTAGQNFAAAFQGGNLLGVTADQMTNWQSSGYKLMPLAGGPVPYVNDDVLVGFYANGGTLPTFVRGVSSPSYIANLGLTGANSFWATANTGLTTAMPGTLGAMTAGNTSYWAGMG